MNSQSVLPSPLNAIVIEAPKGAYRDFGASSDYPLKGVTYPVDYGYLPGYIGEDKADLDFFVGTTPGGMCGWILVDRPDTPAGEHKFIVSVTGEEFEAIKEAFKPVLLGSDEFKNEGELLGEIEKYKDDIALHKAMDSSRKTSILLITGTVGVGKSSVADEVYELLKVQNVPVALINIDEFGYAVPHPADDPFNTNLQIKNLSAIWPNYSEVGVKKLIIPCVVESKEDIERFRRAIPGANILVVRLDATLSTIEDRIKNRHMGGETDWHLRRAKELKELFAQSELEDVIIDTDEKTVRQVAEKLIAPWQ